MSAPRPRPRVLRACAALLLPALVLSGCGGGDGDAGGKKDATSSASPSPSEALPTGDVQVPEGVELTAAGTTLAFGQAAVVAYEPNPERGSVLSMAVTGVQTGRIADFAAYQLDARTKASRPYYVKVAVKNVGEGDLSRSAVPLLAVDTRNTLVQPSSFNSPFRACPSTPLPDGFTAGKSANLCLVYLVPGGGSLTAMSFRPLQTFEPITWKGTIAPPVVEKKTPKKKG